MTGKKGIKKRKFKVRNISLSEKNVVDEEECSPLTFKVQHRNNVASKNSIIELSPIIFEDESAIVTIIGRKMESQTDDDNMQPTTPPPISIFNEECKIYQHINQEKLSSNNKSSGGSSGSSISSNLHDDNVNMLLEINGFSSIRFNKIVNRYLTFEKDNTIKFYLVNVMKILVDSSSNISNSIFNNCICFLSLYCISMYYFYNIYNIFSVEHLQLVTRDDVKFLKVFQNKNMQTFKYICKSHDKINILINNPTFALNKNIYNSLCHAMVLLKFRSQYITDMYNRMFFTISTKNVEEENGLIFFQNLDCDKFNVERWNPDKLLQS